MKFLASDQSAPQVLIFDFDGVLADTLDDMLRYAQEVCAQLGHPRQPTREDLEALDHMSFDEFGKQLEIPSDKVQEFAKRNLQQFASRRQPPRIFDGIREVIVQLSATNKIGIVTGNSSDVVWGFLEQHNLAAYIDVVLDVNDSGTRSEKILKVADRIGHPGSEVYVIGDAVSDIRAAKRAAAKSIAVTWGHQSRKKLEQVQPDYIVRSPTDLLRLFNEA